MLTLVRHGESTGNVLQRWQGITDGPLTESGVTQAELVAQELSKQKFSTIFSSPLSRAIDTAKTIQKALGDPKPPLVVDQRLIELNMGSLEDAPWSTPFQISSRDTRFPDGGESLNDVLIRATSCLDLLNDQEHVLIVSHGMFLTELVHALGMRHNGEWVDVAWSNTGITTLDCNHQFVRINDTRHLYF
ncbi:histidine phosphatase superfamily [Fennellomyces sp. T-0311]|nr:histidine phosphatase superfamily [Fennellomyces sp. T-0311]